MAGLWNTRPNPHSKGFGPLDMSPERTAEARKALEAVRREREGKPGPFDVPIRPETRSTFIGGGACRR